MIRQTFDMEAVNQILTHPDIWKDIAPKDSVPFDAPYVPWTRYYLVGDGAGVIMFHPFRDGVKIHPNFLPSKRGKLAYIAVEEVVQLIFEHRCSLIYAEIDPKLQHVTLFARQLGFRLLEPGDTDLFIRRKLHS